MITALTIAGQPVDLGQVVADTVTVLHGRTSVTDAATAMAADLRLLLPPGPMPSWTSGDSLTLSTEHGPLFTGTISERRLTGHLDTVERGRVGILELSATGPLAQLGFRVVGDQPWPQETETARAARILDLAGAPHDVQEPTTGTVYQVLARDVDAQTALDLLDDLGRDTGAAVVDLPDGTVMYQPIRDRYEPAITLRWQDLPAAMLWSDWGPGTTWADLGYRSPAAPLPVTIPPSAVLWEPQWLSAVAAIVNHVRVGYGDAPAGGDQAFVDATDAASQARYGRRYAYLGTRLATIADATARASHIISTQAGERWGIGSVNVWPELLTADQATALLGLVCGDHVQLDGLPQPAPAQSWPGIVEGWTYQQWWDTDRARVQVTLNLSDLPSSLAVMTWNDYPPTYQWAQHPPLDTWADLIEAPAA